MLRCDPNPFSDVARIQFSIQQNEHITLTIFDSFGRIVKTLFDNYSESGQVYSVEFNGEEYSAGLYFCSLKGEGINEVRKLQILK
jgi:hypothetical protein